MKKNILNIGIFAAASDLASEEYKNMSYIIGSIIGKYGHNLVYGAGTTGLMRQVAEGYWDNCKGTAPFGSTTYSIDKLENPTNDCMCHRIMDHSLAQRKELYLLCDIIIILPGGHGTLSELEDHIVFKQLASKGLGHWNGEIWLVDNDWTKKVQELWNYIYKQDLASSYYEFVDILSINNIDKILQYYKLNDFSINKVVRISRDFNNSENWYELNLNK